MSYEGYTELLCENGHYDTCDYMEDEPKQCYFCGARISHIHSVNQTNGYDEDEPYSCNAPKEKIGFDDEWNNDHYGNRFAREVPRYKPGKHWVERKP